MSEYERYVRQRFPGFFRFAQALLGDEELAALAAQSMCLAGYRDWVELHPDLG